MDAGQPRQVSWTRVFGLVNQPPQPPAAVPVSVEVDAVVVTNSVISNPTFNESKFAESRLQAGSGFVSGGIGGFASGGNVGGLGGTRPVDALGDSSSSSRARDLGTVTDRFYSLSDLAP